MSPFDRLFSGLGREGPGSAADVIWALDHAGTPEQARICDAGCGSGADSETLAESRPAGTVLAVEQAPHLAEEARARLARFGSRVAVRQCDMAGLDGPFDLIWCAGALYFLGVTEGLAGWRNALAPGGTIAFSEPCLVRDTPRVRRFWEGYPALSDLAGIQDRVRAAGFVPLAHREVVGASWRTYYAGLEARIRDLRSASPDPALETVLAAAETEIANWRAAPDDIAYALLLVRPE